MDGAGVGRILQQRDPEVDRDVVHARDLVGARPPREELPGAHPGVLFVAPLQLLDAEPAHALDETSLDLQGCESVYKREKDRVRVSEGEGTREDV